MCGGMAMHRPAVKAGGEEGAELALGSRNAVPLVVKSV